MKRFLIILQVLFLAITLNARQPERGYRGFLEWSNSLCSEKRAVFAPGPGLNIIGYSRVNYLLTGASTSHGYQINSRFFVGAGIGIEHNQRWGSWMAPLFAQGRMDLQFGKFTPYADVRLGWDLTEEGGIYFSPSIGYRFNWGRKLGINIGAGLTLIDYRYYEYGFIPVSVSGYDTVYLKGSYHKAKPYFSFRVGIEF